MMLGVVRSAKRRLVCSGVQKIKKNGIHNAVQGKGDLLKKIKKYGICNAVHRKTDLFGCEFVPIDRPQAAL
ncbi:hypothetical protein ABBQ38_012310 [Trebouxia sp. C0009 RCD-2024]